MKTRTIMIASVLAIGTTIATAEIDRGGATTLGRLADLNLFTVNGITFDVSQATVDRDGQPGTVADLNEGHVIAVSGEIDSATGTGIATHIAYADSIQGPIQAINPDNGSLQILNQVVTVDGSTLIGMPAAPGAASSRANTANWLSIGQRVEVSGFHGADGEIHATRIDLAAPGPYELTGQVTGDDDDGRIEINDLMVDLSRASISGFQDEIEEGDWVEVRGRLAGSNSDLFSAAVVIRRVPGVSLQPEQEVDMEGLITRFASSQDFDVSGTPVRTDEETSFDGIVPAALAVGMLIEIEGQADATGSYVLAEEVSSEEADDEQ